ncbi:hypothetical protein DFH06DRAFT_1146951 [Mycena polygramma]|nr:hypothetical protein DFH06DRAFT_1146951 [Mycena polygramma]
MSAQHSVGHGSPGRLPQPLLMGTSCHRSVRQNTNPQQFTTAICLNSSRSTSSLFAFTPNPQDNDPPGTPVPLSHTTGVTSAAPVVLPPERVGQAACWQDCAPYWNAVASVRLAVSGCTLPPRYATSIHLAFSAGCGTTTPAGIPSSAMWRNRFILDVCYPYSHHGLSIFVTAIQGPRMGRVAILATNSRGSAQSLSSSSNVEGVLTLPTRSRGAHLHRVLSAPIPRSCRRPSWMVNGVGMAKLHHRPNELQQFLRDLDGLYIVGQPFNLGCVHRWYNRDIHQPPSGLRRIRLEVKSADSTNGYESVREAALQRDTRRTPSDLKFANRKGPGIMAISPCQISVPWRIARACQRCTLVALGLRAYARAPASRLDGRIAIGAKSARSPNAKRVTISCAPVGH